MFGKPELSGTTKFVVAFRVTTTGGPIATKFAVTLVSALMVNGQVIAVLQPATPLQLAKTLPPLGVAVRVMLVGLG